MEIKKDDKTGYIVYGSPAKGCRQCVRGEKLVLFITGMCGQRCNFCPVSEKKFGKDIVYANEWPIEKFDDLLEEIRLTDAKGAGITGGDPLVKTERTVEYIKKLKAKFGKKFHTHLYTPFQLVDEKRMKILYEAGLDEIRFHPNLDNTSEWKKIEFALKYKWDIGLEIPCLPDKLDNMKRLLDYFNGKIKFINLNELEFSDTKVSHYNLDCYQTKDNKSYAAKGSMNVGNKLIAYARKKDYSMSVYFCSSFLKDRTQMGNRIKRRAKKTATINDTVTEEGMLVRGCIYLKELYPGFSYREKIKSANREGTLDLLIAAKKKLEKLGIVNIEVDEVKLRIIASENEVRRNKDKIKKLGLVPAVVEEYPTYDSVEIEIELL
jgi:pyruvate formate-lyase activating enzyme-like uncharacterized protein